MAFWHKNARTKRALGLGSTLLGGSLLAAPTPAEAAPADAAPAPTDAPRTDATAPARPLPAARLNAALQAAGTPTFTHEGVQTSPYGIDGPVNELVDLDGNGTLDVLGLRPDGTLVVQLNGDTPTAPAFGPAVDNAYGLPTLEPYSYITHGDLDGDGDYDVVAMQSDYIDGVEEFNAVFVENTGTPTAPAFAAPVEAFGMESSARHAQPRLLDLDGDGDLDLTVFRRGTADEFQIQENTGSTTAPAFSPAGTPAWAPTDGNTSYAALVDLDGDGVRDYLGLRNTAWFFSRMNTGTNAAPAFDPLVEVPFGLRPYQPSEWDVVSYALGDLDGDGDFDIVGYDYQADVAFLRENTGTAGAPDFSLPDPTPIRPFPSTNSVDRDGVLADLDGDGDLDVLQIRTGDSVDWFENTGTATEPAWAAPTQNPFGLTPADGGTGSPFMETLTVADLDGDGALDVLMGDKNDNLFYFENLGTATAPSFGTPVQNPFDYVAQSSDAGHRSVGDVDGDGLPDLVLTYGDGIVYVENDGSTGAPSLDQRTTGTYGLAASGIHGAVLVDLDGDGDLDVLGVSMPNSSSGEVVWQENSGAAGAPAFRAVAAYPDGLDMPGYAPLSLMPGDLDGDGAMDVMAQHTYSYHLHEGEPAVVLPIELSAFDARVDGERVMLAWQTQSEVNALGFGIERRGADDAAWEEIAFVAAGGDRGAAYRQDVEVPVAGRYAFRLRMVDLDGSVAYSPEVEATVEVARSYLMSAAYPNPFNPGATFTLGVQRAQHVEIGLYDLLGRRVATLFDGALDANHSHVVRIDGARLASGTYLVRAQGETFTAAQQVMLVK